VIFVLVLLLVSLPLIVYFEMPVSPGPETNAFYNTIEGLPKTSVVIFSFDYAPAAQAELQPMAQAGLFHAKSRGLRSVIIAFWPQGAPLAVTAAKKVYGKAFPNVPEYGKDVDGGIVLIGYIPGGSIGMSSFASNVWATIGVDHYGTAFSALPLMNKVKSAADFGVFIDWMAGTPGAIQAIMYMHGPYGVKVGTGATAVSIPEAMPYYAAGQLFGLLSGLAGAFEYEMLLKTNYGWELTLLQSMNAQSLGHVLIVIFVVIGNIGFAASKLKRGGS